MDEATREAICAAAVRAAASANYFQPSGSDLVSVIREGQITQIAEQQVAAPRRCLLGPSRIPFATNGKLPAGTDWRIIAAFGLGE